MSLPVTPARGGGIPVQTPAQTQQQNLQQDRLAQQFRLRMAIAENLKRIRHVVIVMSGKGGVGKTTVAVNVAAAFAAKGKRVGILDLDLTNPNVPIMLNLESARPKGSAEDIKPVTLPAPNGGSLTVMSTAFLLREGDGAIIWRGPIKMGVINQLLGNVEWGDLDLLVIDLPPGTGDEPLTIAQLLKDADGVVLVTTPQAVSLLDVKKSLQFARTMELPVLGIVENMATFACPHCSHETAVFGAHGGRDLAAQENVPLLGSIPLEPHVVESGEKGVPYVWRSDASATTRAFHDVIAKLDTVLAAKE